jgi:hypothetical protein
MIFMRKIALVLLILLVAGCGGKTEEQEEPVINQTPQISHLPISERGFYIGTVVTPKNFPDFTSEDHIEAFQMVDQYGEVIPMWKGDGNMSNAMLGLEVLGLETEPIIGTGFEIGENLSDPEVRQKRKDELIAIAEAYKPKYFNIMNEVNLYFHANNNSDPDNIIGLYNEIYDGIKAVSPETKVFPVFAYHVALRENTNVTDFINMFEPKIDLYAFTNYPERNYDSFDEIPDSYYDEIDALSGKKAFTEIGWPGDDEEEQADFLIWFLNTTKDMDLEFMCWLWLHDYPEDYQIPYVTKYFNNQGLRRDDGTPKPVWNLWEELHSLPIVR